MELIKKTFKLVTSGTTGTPAYSAYTMNILLTSNNIDWGFFNTYTGLSGVTIDNITYEVTGLCTSRLFELKKYTLNNSYSVKYRQSNNPSIDGLDITRSVTASTTGTTLVYYIGGITYNDIIPSDTGITAFTTFKFTGVGYNSPNFDNYAIYKDETLLNINEQPRIDPDVFIERQSLSVFENNYRLKEINKLFDLLSYAGGSYFKIIDNV